MESPELSQAGSQASSIQTGPMPGLSDGPLARARSKVPWWAWVVPFFLSAVLFRSVFLAIFAPLPILIFFLNTGRKWAWLAALTNVLVVAWMTGIEGAAAYFVWFVSVALALPEFLKRTKSLERASVFTLLTMFALAVMAILVYSSIHHLQLLHVPKQLLTSFLEQLDKWVAAGANGGPDAVRIDPAEWEDLRDKLRIEFPSMVAVGALVVVFANLSLVLRLNPGRVREQLGILPGFFRKWKSPEFLLWPTIAAGALLVFDAGHLSDVGLNVFKFLMAIYAIHGLSILSFVFDVWNIRGLVRSVAYVIALMVMLPLLLSLGFFDLWFDFRGKLRQS